MERICRFASSPGWAAAITVLEGGLVVSPSRVTTLQTHRAYALQLSIAKGLEAKFCATSQLAPDVLGNDHLSRFRRLLDSRCRVDPVAVEIAIVCQRDVTDMNAHPEIVRVTTPGRLLRIVFAQCGCGAHRLFGARELGQDCVTHELHDSTAKSPDHLTRQGLKNFDQTKRGALVGGGACAVFRDVGKPDSGEVMGSRHFFHTRCGDA